MKKPLLFSILFGFNILFAFSQEKYVYTIDLVNVANDQVKVTLVPPKISSDECIFVMPSAIPGSYAEKNYGTYVTKFKAYNKEGKMLKVKVVKHRDFIIENPSDLAKIEYWVNDTWDSKDKKHLIFQPGGSNIDKDKNFVLNNFAFFGYFEGQKDLPFEINVTKPQEMYGTTYLSKTNKSATQDLITAPDYFQLSDNPIMYCRPDTVSFRLGQTTIHTSVYCHSGKIKSKEISDQLVPLAKALELFLGKLPVNEYYFIFYFTGPKEKVLEGKKGLGGHGALEHNHCSFYYLPELDSTWLKQMVQDVAAHEFMHTLAPLHLHSKEIADFNFRQPEWSKHLWLYEGLTEYFSWLLRLRGGLVTEEEFFYEMCSKIKAGDKYAPFSFTEMSRNVTTSENQVNYLNVYQEGALLGLFLDIRINQLSKGKLSLMDVIRQLAEKYGPTRPFDDEVLFDEIVALTYPEIAGFFSDYVEGKKQIDYSAFFETIGYDYRNDENASLIYFGYLAVRYVAEQNQVRFKTANRTFGIFPGDVLISINDQKVTLDNFSRLGDKYFGHNITQEHLNLVIERNGERQSLSGQGERYRATLKYYLEPMADPHVTQLRLRTTLLEGKKD